MNSRQFLSLSVSLLRFLLMSTPVVNGALRNQTIDDFDVTITYLPENNWQKSNNLTCLDCLQPEPQFASGQTYHYGFHPNPGPDADDLPPPNGGNLVDPDAGPDDDENGQADGDEKSQTTEETVEGSKPESHEGQKGKSGGGKGKRRLTRLLPRDPDPDDKNFHDIQVSATINFTGSAIYVFCILPINVNNASALSTTNLTFILDGESVQPSFRQKPRVISTSPTAFNYTMPPVFSRENLEIANHSLSIIPMIGSVVFLDKIIVTEANGDGTAGGDTPGATSSGIIASQTQGGHKKNVATFAVAIGTTMGVLAVVSFAVFISIYYRRRRSASHRELQKAREASLRPPSPEMRGLAQPFIPRYFPGSSPYRSPSIATASSGSRRTSGEGPSHGLNYPLAPEIPPYSPSSTTTVTSTTRSPSTIPLVIASRPPVSRLQDSNDVVPPSYNEAQSMPLVTVPSYTLITQPQPSIVSSSLTDLPPLETVMLAEEGSIPVNLAPLSPLVRSSSTGTHSPRSLREGEGTSPVTAENSAQPTSLIADPDDRPPPI